jgi:transcriptional regulator with XRE-family HTH domain
MTETEINQTISNNLWTIRNNTYKLVQVKDKIKKKRLTQTEVGKAINVTFQQIQKFEKGINNIGSAKLKILANFFGLPVGDMYEPIETYHKEIGE